MKNPYHTKHSLEPIIRYVWPETDDLGLILSFKGCSNLFAEAESSIRAIQSWMGHHDHFTEFARMG